MSRPTINSTINPTMTKTRAILTTLVCLLTGGVLMGPAPGEIGGCGKSIPVADAEEHCINVNAWECRRLEARGQLTGTVQQCFDSVLGSCTGAQWPFTCSPFPTKMESDACVEQLSFVDNINLPLGQIAECNLCGGGTNNVPDASVPEAGAPEAGVPDAGIPDASLDATPDDAIVPDTNGDDQ